MNFLNKFFSLKGRVCRSEYFLRSLLVAVVVVALVLGVAFMVVPSSPESSDPFDQVEFGVKVIFLVTVSILAMIYWWASLSLSVRRLHDLGRSGWFFLISFIPIVNIFFYIYVLFFRGNPGENRFGENPLVKYLKKSESASN